MGNRRTGMPRPADSLPAGINAMLQRLVKSPTASRRLWLQLGILSMAVRLGRWLGSGIPG